MKEAVTFSCRCTIEVELPRDKNARVAMRRQMESHSCRKCAYQEKVQEARKRATERGLVELTGTPGQVDYGLILRDQQVSLFLEQLALAERFPEDPRIEQMRQHLIATVNLQRKAAWWIEHQGLKHLRSLLTTKNERPKAEGETPSD